MSENTIKCPHCAEEISADAKVCKHCGRDVRQSRNRMMFVIFIILCVIAILLVAQYVIGNAQRGIF